MFYCDQCATKLGWDQTFSRSYGNCEMCGYERPCNDGPGGTVKAEPAPATDDYNPRECPDCHAVSPNGIAHKFRCPAVASNARIEPPVTVHAADHHVTSDSPARGNAGMAEECGRLRAENVNLKAAHDLQTAMIESAADEAERLTTDLATARATIARLEDEKLGKIIPPCPYPADLDATDGACPAWWRGDDHGCLRMIGIVNEILDGKRNDGTYREPLESLRKRLMAIACYCEGRITHKPGCPRLALLLQPADTGEAGNRPEDAQYATASVPEPHSPLPEAGPEQIKALDSEKENAPQGQQAPGIGICEKCGYGPGLSSRGWCPYCEWASGRRR